MGSENLTARLASLSPAKRALLEQRLMEKRGETSMVPSISRRPAGDTAPLSFAQQRLWFLNQLEPESPAYNEANAFRLHGILDFDPFKKALNQIVLRHEVLRTVIVTVEGSPRQMITNHRDVDLPVIDLRAVPTPERDSEAQRLIAETIRKPFDLAHDLPLRVLLLRLGEQEHMFLVVNHHIASDGWSSGIFWRELTTLYRAFSTGEPSPLSELPIQYADYAVWQREWLQGEVLKKRLAYWKNQLHAIDTLQLPTDLPRPALRSYQGKRQTIELSTQLCQELGVLSRRQGVTLFMTLLAAFQTLLYRYTGQNDIAVGSPIAGRTRAEIEGLIGFFVNTLVLRTDLCGNPSFNELLQRVRKTALEAYEHQEVPFEKLVEELKPERNPSHSPLFQVMFVLQNTPTTAFTLPGSKVTRVDIVSETTKFDLTLTVHDGAGALGVSLQYSTDLFGDPTIARMLEQYHILLREVVANPDQRVDTFRLMDPSERKRLVEAWSKSAPADSRDITVREPEGLYVTSYSALTTVRESQLSLGQMIAEWSRRTPEAFALKAPGRLPLNYARLQAHIDFVAAQLSARGIGRNDRVALLLPNGPEMATAFLAVTVASATCAPLNPGYRAEELDSCLSDLQAKALIVQAGGEVEAKRVAAERGISILEILPAEKLEAGLFTLEPAAMRSLSIETAQPDDIALLLHTSGTTVRPKLVPLSHANLVASARNIQATFALTSADISLNVMPLFHVHGLVGSLLSSLAAGASVVCTPGLYAPGFLGWLEEFQPTWYTAVPTMHQAILTRSQSHLASMGRYPLRFIRSCSAALPRPLMRELEMTFRVPVIESYGMTEAAHQIASNPLPPAQRKEGSVGRATGTEILIVDETGNPVPAGATGEVLVRGPSVTSGYENDIGANASTFIDGWCRTGDQGSLDSEGYLFLTGRFKEIINRGGEKISPREIDEYLMSHAAVAQAVSFPVPNPVLGEEVAAAVVLREQSTVTARELREFIATRLADFKVPRQLVILDAIPTGPSGKVQRNHLAESLGLRALDQAQAVEPGVFDFEALKTPLESMLGSIWAKVLGLGRIGRQEHFLQLGGDSLLAGQIIARVRTSLQVQVSLIDFFEAPTVAGLARTVEKARESHQVLQPLPPRQPHRGDAFPLSYAQQALWFLDQLEPGSLANNRPAALRLTGALDVPAMAKSIDAIVSRHEALRTIYPMIDGSPMQVIAAIQPVSLLILDLTTLPEEKRETRARELAVEEARRPFELARGPLWRTSLLKLSENNHILIVVLHHIASDGWSSEVFFRELAICYNAFLKGMSPDLPLLTVQYADFAVWERQRLEGEYLEKLLAYWKEQLGPDLPPRLKFTNSGPHPSLGQPRQGAHQVLELPASLTRALKTFSQNNDVTLFVTLLSSFKILLYRYTGRQDLMVGVPVAGRKLEEFEGLIGDFINLLPICSDLSGNPSFRAVLDRVNRATLQAHGHQDLPLAKLAEVLRAERRIDIRSALQVIFNLRNFPSPRVAFNGLQSAPVDFDDGIARFDLSLDVTEKPDGLLCLFEHDTAQLDSATLSQFVAHFQVLLEEIVANPDQSIGALPIQRELERRQTPEVVGVATGAAPPQHGIHRLFEIQAARKRTATAVVFEGNGLSYDALNRRANQLAHYLWSLGVGPDNLVGICVERSLEMAIGVLGILKAGGAYVPLDPHYPPERLALMLQDSQVSVVLTQERLRAMLPPHSAQSVALDADWPTIALQSDENPDGPVSAEHLAYVMYTSGSTGKPKGVLITHGGVVNHSIAIADLFALGPEDRVAHCNSLSFDISVEEIFSAWINGASVVLCPSQKFLPDEDFAGWIVDEEITVLNLPTAFWHEWVNTLETHRKSISDFLRLVVVGGDKAASSVLARWQTIASPRVRWINSYGPTEATVTTTVYEERFSGLPKDHGKTIPIGRPIGGAEVYVLDGSLEPVPIGVAGELYIGGAGLARGYLNRPELTSEQFIASPFSKHAGARLYRTGDLCRYLADGNIEFLGRSDHQVKIRGFRIEPGEIEAVLLQHPGVREAIVLARQEAAKPESGMKPTEKLLAAYVVPRQMDDLLPDLRNFVKTKLPDYMVPSAFMFLDKLPLTPNGKIDPKALPAPDQRRPELEVAYVAPRTFVEEVIAEIWAEVLNLRAVGIHDDFFTLGGHSLLATQAISRVSRGLQVEVPLRALFEGPTVAKLARRIEDARVREPRLLRSSVLPVRRDKQLPLSFSQQRLWFLDQYEPNSSVYNLSGVWRLSGELDLGALERSLNEIVRRHESLRTTFSMVDGEAVQIIAPSLKLSLPVVDLRDHPEDEREERARSLVGEEAARPFDLLRGPLVHTAVVRLAEEDHVLLLTMHHIVSDGWSMGVLHRELSLLYRAFVHGEPAPLRALPVQYADFAIWQREWLRGEVLERQLTYWKRQLEGIPAVLNLPTDRPRPAMQSFRGARQSFWLSEDLAGKLKALSRKEGVTLFMTLLAAFQTLLHRYTGQEDIVVGSPIANRNRPEIEGLIGFFVNTLVLRTRFSGDQTFKALLAGVKETTLGAYAHQDLPFEKLVEELNPERSLGHSPLFQVMFALQNAPRAVLELEDLRISSMRLRGETAKFDLILSISELKDGLQGSFEYATDLFDETTVLRMLGHFEALLEEIVANPEQRISRLPILTENEEYQLLVSWTSTTTAREHAEVQSVHELFEEQVEKNPSAVAVIFEEEELSYRELNERANQAARCLIEQGVGPDVLVPICVSRSVDMLVGILAILKAGGAYVPLDPDYPEERWALLLGDVGATVLLTQSHLVDRCAGHAPRALLLDRSQDIARGSGKNRASGAARDNLAYVLYTSGSTGMPKGVAMSHDSLLNLLSWQLAHFTGPTQARTLQFAPLSFDVSFQEIFSTLCAGGTLVLIPEEVRRDAVALWRYLGTKSVDRLFLPFVALQQLAEAAQSEESLPDTLREVITAGEQLQVTQPIVDLFSRLKDCKLHNQYGPTESHVVSALALMDPPHSWPRLPSIGRPIANIQIYILDTHLTPVPMGVPGELYIGGDGLARGYFKRPELTAEKFIANPFSAQPGARLYRTGDRARYLADGNIEFLGRTDHQVKIRGVRIEPGEIETMLSQYPAVREAVVVAREEIPGDKWLVGYVVPGHQRTPGINELKSFLKQKLPEYMVPSSIVFLDSLPLTPNGKLDRKALPAPDQRRPDLEELYVAPRTTVEEMIAEIWAEVLRLATVGIHDNFFDLGGHSLKATQVVSRLRQTFRLDLALRVLFEAPTVAELAVRVEQSLADTGELEELARYAAEVNSLTDEEIERQLRKETQN